MAPIETTRPNLVSPPEIDDPVRPACDRIETLENANHRMRDALERFFADSKGTEAPEVPGFVYVSPATAKAMRLALEEGKRGDVR